MTFDEVKKAVEYILSLQAQFEINHQKMQEEMREMREEMRETREKMRESFQGEHLRAEELRVRIDAVGQDIQMLAQEVLHLVELQRQSVKRSDRLEDTMSLMGQLLQRHENRLGRLEGPVQ